MHLSPVSTWIARACWIAAFAAGTASAASLDSPDAAAAAAQALLEPGQQAAALAQASVFDSFTRRQDEPLKPDPLGGYHLRFDRSHRGVPVVGGDIVVHLRPDGTLDRVTNGLSGPLALPSATPRMARDDALQRSLDAFRAKGRETSSAALLVIAAWPHIAPVPTLAWRVELVGHHCGHPSRMQYWYDANSGALLDQHDEQESMVPMACPR